mmetsp:Transcript_10212/g.15322  ORF Transcript_10212/g.15322 Transcript_10212/m.15322 type:complete len:215 (-) Transcript_10212:410-1054(-)|eukprot:CAMPEP_0116010310 /NCGR_PEP_ID=MMETSP0321-20121206/3930_1 /TAXON_ID=163516 /ORGANISM="Leptocylindrus danicus var. danicus, Strain B650" /LENGTH=214 /DNA_ID=CAMNT_0003479395 /DNA_START=238 /DNA_END=882 /DNA_ORIENTATION=-
MANAMCHRRLTREYQALLKNPLTSPSIHALPNESNILEWHYVIEGSEGSPYAGGHYHGKLIFPKEYPLKPPSVILLTPSGRFKPNRRLCLSMSDFHPESWNPMWSVSTILTGLYSFMLDTAPTLGSIESSTEAKRKFAKHSLEYNTKDPNFCKMFPELVELYKERKRAAVAAGERVDEQASVTVPSEDDEVQGILAAGAAVIAILSILFALRFM